MTDRLSAAATLPFGALAVVLLGVGGVAVVAEWRGDWESYFIMEQAITAITPFAIILAAAAVLSGFVIVLRSP